MCIVWLSVQRNLGFVVKRRLLRGECVEDVTSHLMPHLRLHSTFRTYMSYTILRATSKFATVNTTYTSDSGKSNDFNTAARPNCLQVKAHKLMTVRTGESNYLNFDHQFIENEKYNAKKIYKIFRTKSRRDRHR